MADREPQKFVRNPRHRDLEAEANQQQQQQQQEEEQQQEENNE